MAFFLMFRIRSKLLEGRKLLCDNSSLRIVCDKNFVCVNFILAVRKMNYEVSARLANRIRCVGKNNWMGVEEGREHGDVNIEEKVLLIDMMREMFFRPFSFFYLI